MSGNAASQPLGATAPAPAARLRMPRGGPLTIVCAAAAVVSVVLGILEGVAAGLGTLALLLSVGGLALTAAHTAALRRDRVGPLSRQLSAAVAIAIGQMLLAVVAVGELMFVSRHDALVVSLIALFTGVVAIVATRLLTAPMLHDVEAIRDGLMAVGDGRRDVRVVTTGRDELAELAGAANAMIVRLEAEEGARDASDAARRSLIAAVSHDLRTPITSLQLLAEAVADDVVDDSMRRTYIERMGTHIRALSALIDDLFELSRLESGDISWSLERVSLPELVGETVAALRVQAEAKGVAVRLEVPSALAPARANPEKVQRVLFNLIQNAIRHTPADGSVTVRAEPGADGVEIEVADTGDGIAAGDRDRVFEAFFRGGSEAARTSSGAGLGLAISRAIVEAHGGRIWLEDSERGTRVRFALPAAA